MACTASHLASQEFSLNSNCWKRELIMTSRENTQTEPLIFAPVFTTASLTITNKTLDRVLEFLQRYPEQSQILSEKINEAINDLLTLEEYAAKIGLFWQVKEIEHNV
jgi:ubiquinone biosynthesis protein Coq4